MWCDTDIQLSGVSLHVVTCCLHVVSHSHTSVWCKFTCGNTQSTCGVLYVNSYIPHVDESQVRVYRNRISAQWDTTFISPKVRITRREFLRILCKKFGLRDSWSTHVKLVRTLRYQCAGELAVNTKELNRKFVGIGKTSPDRRDFVRIRRDGPANDTCTSAQILMFIHIDGFTDDSSDGIVLPEYLRTTTIDNLTKGGEINNTSVTLALVRWLDAHPEAVVRDSQQRPVCKPPFDINHALWVFSKTRRPELTHEVIVKNINSFPGCDVESKMSNAKRERSARFDVLQPESFESFINCTVVNEDRGSILETITLPFR